MPLLVRIAELFVHHIGTYRRAILFSLCHYWYVSQSYLLHILVRIAELIDALFGTYRRAICGGYWYVSQSYLLHNVVRIAELFSTIWYVSQS